MLDRVADARLRSEVHYDRGLVCFENFVYKGLVSNAAPDENMSDRRRDRIDNTKAVLLELRIIVVVHIVEADHCAALHLAQQAHNEVGTNETGRAGDQDRSAV